MTSSNTDLTPSICVNGFPLMNYIIMAGQSHTTHTHFLICMDLFCTNCQCFRPKKDMISWRSQGLSSRLKCVTLLLMVKKLVDSILVIVCNLDFKVSKQYLHKMISSDCGLIERLITVIVNLVSIQLNTTSQISIVLPSEATAYIKLREYPLAAN